jgi:hypothetical protein
MLKGVSELLNQGFKEVLARKDKLKNNAKTTTIRDINNVAKHNFQLLDYVYMQQSNYPEKVFFFEKFKRVGIEDKQHGDGIKIGDIEYRISYHIVSRKKDTKTPESWRFGQYSAMIPPMDFKLLLSKAEKAGIYN